MHDILSKVIVPEDLELALTESFESGSIDAEERDEIRSMLSARIASARERGWFPADRNCVFNETLTEKSIVPTGWWSKAIP